MYDVSITSAAPVTKMAYSTISAPPSMSANEAPATLGSASRDLSTEVPTKYRMPISMKIIQKISMFTPCAVTRR